MERGRLARQPRSLARPRQGTSVWQWDRQLSSVTTKGILAAWDPDRRSTAPRRRGLLALTFGTLLSSQGADAHRSGSLDPSWGNLHTVRGSAGAVKHRHGDLTLTTRQRPPLAIVPCERCRREAWWPPNRPP